MKVHVVDLKNETIASPVSVRAYLNQTITEFKQLIAQVTLLNFFICISSSFLNLFILRGTTEILFKKKKKVYFP